MPKSGSPPPHHWASGTWCWESYISSLHFPALLSFVGIVRFQYIWTERADVLPADRHELFYFSQVTVGTVWSCPEVTSQCFQRLFNHCGWHTRRGILRLCLVRAGGCCRSLVMATWGPEFTRVLLHPPAMRKVYENSRPIYKTMS